MLIIAKQTTFEPYVPERYSKKKEYNEYSKLYYSITAYGLQSIKRICKNCHQPLGKHMTFHNTPGDIHCPTTYILQ